MTNDELKELLFKTIDEQMDRYLEEKTHFGTYSDSARLEHAKFCILYDLVENAGIESEYIEWKYGNIRDELKKMIDKTRS